MSMQRPMQLSYFVSSFLYCCTAQKSAVNKRFSINCNLLELILSSRHQIVGSLVLLTAVLQTEFKLLEKTLVLILVNVLAPSICKFKQTIKKFFLIEVVSKLWWLAVTLCLFCFSLILTVIIEIFFNYFSEIVRVNTGSQNHTNLYKNAEVFFFTDHAV